MGGSIVERLRSIGPGAMVAAAFIGPGTVTTASVTGASFGYALVWTIVFSAVATIVLREMSARLGFVTGSGLGEALRERFAAAIPRWISVALVVSAIGVGTAAYEAGNILGGAAGLEVVTGISANVWGPVMGLVAGALLWTGNYEYIERALVGLVGVMAVAFVADAIIVGPGWEALALGFVPGIPDGALYLVTGLIGMTVVGYNLFLHASSVTDRWAGAADLPESRIDTVLSVVAWLGVRTLLSIAGVTPV